MEMNMFPLSREMFVDIMTRYRKTVDISNGIFDLYQRNERLFIYGGAVLPSIIDDVIDLMNIIFGLKKDENDNTVLEYWIREQDFGRSSSKEYDFICGGKKLPVGLNAGEIFDLICQMKS